MENFWSTLKIELVFDNTWATQTEAENALFDWIDGWYNPTRIQKRLGWRSPDEYERSLLGRRTRRRRPAQPDLTHARGGPARRHWGQATACPRLLHQGPSRLTGQGRPQAVTQRS